MSKVKILLLRRWYMVGGAALVLAALGLLLASRSFRRLKELHL